MEAKKNVRIRINLTTREFEIDAEPDFLFEKFGDRIFEYLDLLKSNKTTVGDKNTVEEITKTIITNIDLPDSFGEYYNKFPKNLNNVDKLLISAYYIQSTNENKSFVVKDASDLLIDQGVKLTNANAFNTANLSTKRVFKLSGKNFKVSDIGKEYIKNQLNNNS
jgi:hypothetical protein